MLADSAEERHRRLAFELNRYRQLLQREAKELGVADICFAKKRGLQVPDMVRSTWVYQKLRDFRAGIEGVISFLKRAFGLDRCTWRGEVSFRSYVWSGVLTANLLTLARHMLA